MAPIDYSLMCDGYGDRQKEQTMHTRAICWQILCSNPPKNPPKSIEQWWPVNQDKPVTKAQTARQRKKENAIFEAAIKEFENK